MQYRTIGETIYLWFGANDTSGSGGDGSSADALVRLGGAASTDAPIYSTTPYLLSHADYPEGCYEVEIPATVGNGFADRSTYGVFCTLAIDSQNPTGALGGFYLGPAPASLDLSALATSSALSDVLADTNEIQQRLANGGSIDLLIDQILSDTTAIKAKTDNLPVDPADESLIIAATDAIVALIGALNDLSSADVSTAVETLLSSTARAEPSPGAPSADTDLVTKLSYVYLMLRNESITTDTEQVVKDDAGASDVMKASLSKAVGSFTKGKFGAP